MGDRQENKRGNIHEFSAFLFRFSLNFTKDDVEDMKYLLKNTLTAQEVEKANKAYHIFEKLEKRDCLSEDNFSILEDLCRTMNKDNLCKEIDDFKGGKVNLYLPKFPDATQANIEKPSSVNQYQHMTSMVCSTPKTKQSENQDSLIGPIEQPHFKDVKTESYPMRHKNLPSGGIVHSPEGIPLPDEENYGKESADKEKFDVVSVLQNVPQPPSHVAKSSETKCKEVAVSSLETNFSGAQSISSNGANSTSDPHCIPALSIPSTVRALDADCPTEIIYETDESQKCGKECIKDTIEADGPEELKIVQRNKKSVDEDHTMELVMKDSAQASGDHRETKNLETRTLALENTKEEDLEEDDIDNYFDFNVSSDIQSLPTSSAHKPFLLRPYQAELSESALKCENCIICAPTGSGKTITAAYICKEIRGRFLAENKPFKALFIVCIRNLVSQQREAFHKVFVGEDKDVVDALDPELNIKDMMGQCDIIMLTAQTLVNELEKTDQMKKETPNYNGLEISDFDMLIFDECHHANLKHPYNQCMRIYHRVKRAKRGKMPQIIGMTASLGVGEKENPVDHYIKICANLDCKTISHVTNTVNYAALLEECPVPSVKQIVTVTPRLKTDKFALELHNMMEQIEMTFAPSDRGVADRGSQLYEAWAVNCRIRAENNGDRISRVKYEALNYLNNALMIYDELQAKNGLAYIREKFNVEDPTNRPEEPINEEQYVYDLIDDRMDKLLELAAASDKELNPKLQSLVILLLTLNQRGMDTNTAKGILLSRTRLATQAIVDFIREREDLKTLVFPDRLVGQGGDDLTMSDKKQQQVIKRFRGGVNQYQGKNLLVATDVAQEGLDIPTCNYVIRYNFVSNEIGSVQSRGRARAKNSESYLIVTKGSINEKREIMNLRREHLMMQALTKIDQLDQKDLEKKILSMQKSLWDAYIREIKYEQARKSQIKPEDVEILCKKCGIVLCQASDMLQKGSQYVCITEEFEEKIEKKSGRKEDFRLDQIIGYIRCADPSCQLTLGPWFRYKNGSRHEGFVLSAKNITFKIKGTPVGIKQWSKLPCQIPIEALY